MRLNIKFLQAGFYSSIKPFCILLGRLMPSILQSNVLKFEVPGIEFSLNAISSKRMKVAIQYEEPPYPIKHRDVLSASCIYHKYIDGIF